MSSEENKQVSSASRFQKGVPHYHRSSREEANGWDEWTGEPLKTPARQMRERIIYTIGAVFVGCLLLMGILALVFFFWRKIFPMLEF